MANKKIIDPKRDTPAPGGRQKHGDTGIWDRECKRGLYIKVTAGGVPKG